ncbi:MAG: hypothetical protein K8F25_12880 [Fimbriimonadaceae bacterium]|nr:hypothetical protein [Alphaproteobacteria bacterium]
MPFKEQEALARMNWVSLLAARTKIAEVRYGLSKLEIGHEEGDDYDLQVVEREHLEQADQDLLNALKNRDLIAYWRTDTMSTERNMIDAQTFDDPRVWNVIVKARRSIKDITPSSANYLASAVIEIPEVDILKWIIIKSQKKSEWPENVGAPRKASKEFVNQIVEKAMQHHGEFHPDDSKWNTKAKLAKHLIKECEKQNIDLSWSTARSYIEDPLKKWREKHAKK